MYWYDIKFEISFILLYKNTQDINEMCDSVNMNDRIEIYIYIYIYYNYEE